MLIIPHQIFPCEPRTDMTNHEFNSELKAPLVPFMPEVYIMAGITDNKKVEILTLAEFITAQTSEAHCRAALTSVGKQNTHFNGDSDRGFVRASTLDSVSQRVVPASPRLFILHLGHYFLLAGYHGKRQMYNSKRKKLYWPNTANDVYATVRDCRSCSQNHTHRNDQLQLELFFRGAHWKTSVWAYWALYQKQNKTTNL